MILIFIITNNALRLIYELSSTGNSLTISLSFPFHLKKKIQNNDNNLMIDGINMNWFVDLLHKHVKNKNSHSPVKMYHREC